MSARGARSRKAVAKDIEKKEKKAAQKGKTPASSLGSSDALSRSGTSSNLSRTASTSRSSSVHTAYGRAANRLDTIHSNGSFDIKALRRPGTSTTDNASISESSTQGREKKKYQARNGKETKAPRGRGGGVPIKQQQNTASSLQSPVFRSETRASTRVPSGQKTWIDFRIWEGGDTKCPPYGGWDYDEHMQTGNVLVYFKEEQAHEDHPIPQIRCDLGVLENAGSTWLSNALLYGRIDEDEDSWSAGESSQPPPPFEEHMGRNQMSPTNDNRQYYGVPRNGTASRAQYYDDMDQPNSLQSPRPPQSSPRHHHEIRPTHELWFTAPSRCRTPQEQRLHHVAIRNFLALLHGKPIVGADLYEMLTTLQSEIDVMYDLDYDNSQSHSSQKRSVQMITNYLQERGLVDLRNNIKTSLALLAWSESDSVKWRWGYLESFVHLVGVMSSHMEDLADFKRLSIVTRRNLAITAKGLQLRIMDAEERLSSFDFSDLWSAAGGPTDSIKGGIGGPVHQSYTAFRQFLINHFTRTYGSWPPNDSQWLDRTTLFSLQKDFGALYDYLVDREVLWDSREERPGKKWQMVHTSDDSFTDELQISDALVAFDTKHGYMHIPHPYPLLPKQVAGMQQSKPKEKKGLFSGFSRKKDKEKDKVDTGKDAAKARLQLSIVFGDATNIEKMDVDFQGSTLIDSFESFELSPSPTISPREARLGRWILLYSILQVLSTLSVDVRDLKFTQGVRYFLCADLRRCPEWVTGRRMEYLEASQARSWCWTRPWALSRTAGSREPAELEAVGNERRRLGGAADLATAREMGDTTPRQQHQQPVGDPGSWDDDGGATLINDDIRRIAEKIDNMSMSANTRRIYEAKLAKEKVRGEEFNVTRGNLGKEGQTLEQGQGQQQQGFRPREDSFRLPPMGPLSPYERSSSRGAGTGQQREQMQSPRSPPPPMVPLRSPRRSPTTSYNHQTQQGGYFPTGKGAEAPTYKQEAYKPEAERAGWV